MCLLLILWRSYLLCLDGRRVITGMLFASLEIWPVLCLLGTRAWWQPQLTHAHALYAVWFFLCVDMQLCLTLACATKAMDYACIYVYTYSGVQMQSQLARPSPYVGAIAKLGGMGSLHFVNGIICL